MRYSMLLGGGIPTAPSRSERRRPWQDSAFAALDFEATGLDFSRDRIISFGVVPINDGQLGIDRAVYGLVDPGPWLPHITLWTMHT